MTLMISVVKIVLFLVCLYIISTVLLLIAEATLQSYRSHVWSGRQYPFDLASIYKHLPSAWKVVKNWPIECLEILF